MKGDAEHWKNWADTGHNHWIRKCPSDNDVMCVLGNVCGTKCTEKVEAHSLFEQNQTPTLSLVAAPVKYSCHWFHLTGLQPRYDDSVAAECLNPDDGILLYLPLVTTMWCCPYFLWVATMARRL